MDATNGLLMAVKQVEVPSTASDERKISMTDALEREIELLKDLQHANIVQYLCAFFTSSLYPHPLINVLDRLVFRRRVLQHLLGIRSRWLCRRAAAKLRCLRGAARPQLRPPNPGRIALRPRARHRPSRHQGSERPGGQQGRYQNF